MKAAQDGCCGAFVKPVACSFGWSTLFQVWASGVLFCAARLSRKGVQDACGKVGCVSVGVSRAYGRPKSFNAKGMDLHRSCISL